MKKLLTESALRVGKQGTALQESTGRPGYIVESDGQAGRPLIVKLPVTTLDQKNENGRTYSRSIMEGAMRRTKPAFESMELLSTADEHPEEPYPTPTRASHVVIDSWCENDGYMWNKWRVLDTAKGRDLRALIEAGAAFGVSIRGLGSMDNYGNIMDDYEYLGTDCVGQPSARIRTAPQQVSESTRHQPSPAVQENTTIKKDVSAMQTAAQLKKHLKEQITLAKTEARSEAFKRVMKLEQDLTNALTQTDDPREISSMFTELDAFKESLFGGEGSAQPLTEGKQGAAPTEREKQLEEQLKQLSKNFRTKVTELAETFKRSQTGLKSALESANRKATLQERRAQAAIRKANALSEDKRRIRAQLAESKRLAAVAESKRVSVAREAVKLQESYKAARQVAIETTVKYKEAVRVAARTVKEGLKRQSQAPALQQEARQPRRPGVVRTEAVHRDVRPAADQRPRHVTEANLDGTTKLRGFI